MAASASTTVVLVSLAGNAGVAVLKFVAAAATGSAAMLAEAVHSLARTGNQGLLLLGIARAKRAPDATHPPGHGMEVYFWAFVVAILLFSLGAGVALYEGIDRLQRPYLVANPMMSFAVLGVAILFEAVSLWLALRELGRHRADGASGERQLLADPALYTVLLEGVAAIAGVLVALAGTLVSQVLGWVEGDAVTSIAIGLILGSVAAFMSLQTRDLLTGEAAAPETVAAIRAIMRQELGRDGPNAAIDDLRTIRLSPEHLLVAASLRPRESEASRAVNAAAIGRLERRIKQHFPAVRHLFIEMRGTVDTIAPEVSGRGAGMTDVHPVTTFESGALGATTSALSRGAIELGHHGDPPPSRGKDGKR